MTDMLIGPGDPVDTPLRCPNCGASLPADPVTGQIVICLICLRSVVLGDPPRLAVAADTTTLSDAALAALRRARGLARKAQTV